MYVRAKLKHRPTNWKEYNAALKARVEWIAGITDGAKGSWPPRTLADTIRKIR